MRDYSFHALFYYRVLSPLQGLKGGDGDSLANSYPRKKGEPAFHFGWEQRPNFQFHYQRDKFLVSRDRFVLIGEHGARVESSAVFIRTDAKDENAIIYRAPLERIFGDDSNEALQELKELLEKFYTITVEDRSNVPVVDFSNDRHGVQAHVMEI